MEIRITQDSKGFEGFPVLRRTEVCACERIPMVDYDKVFYFLEEKNRQIVACKIKAVVLGRSETISFFYFVLNTPTGVKVVETGSIRLFKSAEDCLQYTIGQADTYRFETACIKDVLPNECSMGYQTLLFNPTHKRCFVFSQGKVMNTSAEMRYVVFDRNGCTICIPKTTSNLCQKIYLSKEDCVKENVNGMSIVDFPEDNDTPQTTEVVVSTKREPKIVTLCFIEK